MTPGNLIINYESHMHKKVQDVEKWKEKVSK